MKEIDWKILLALYDKRSMTKAAESLYMTQSALTKRIQAIEAEWHTEIVKRTSQGVIFTESGKYLVQRAAVMVDFMKEIADHFSDNAQTKELLRIGVPNSFARLHMSELFREYVNTYNKVQLRTISNSSDILMQKLADGSLDIAIICGDYPYLGEKTRLFEEELYLIAPIDANIDDIDQYPLIESFYNPMGKSTIIQWWNLHFGDVPHESHRVPYADIAIDMADKGLGVTFLFGDKWKINEDRLKRIPICDRKGQAITRAVWMMFSDKCFMHEDIMNFIALVEKHYNVNQ